MRFVLIVLAIAIPLIGEVRAQGLLTANLSDEQAQQLHQAVCSEPAHAGRQSTWACDHPRSYPDITSPAFCPVNTLYFSSGRDGLFEIFFGKFTANRPQAIAMYRAECEPHANSFGGMALFNVVDQKFELVRYFRGIRPVDCVVAPPQRDGRQTPYCYSSFMAQGIVGESFGPLRFKRRGEVVFDSWFQAGNSDGHLGLTTSCKTNKPKPRRIWSIRLDEAKSEIVLDVEVLDPDSVASACDRFRKGDFNEEERNVQKRSLSAKGLAFIRPDERQFGMMEVRFRPPSAKAKVEP